MPEQYKTRILDYLIEDQTPWQSLSEGELKERKLEFQKYIAPQLKNYASTVFRGSYIAAHKSLYFKGQWHDSLKTDLEMSEKFGAYGTATLFYLWYHPKFSKELVINTIERGSRPPLYSEINEKIRKEANKRWGGGLFMGLRALLLYNTFAPNTLYTVFSAIPDESNYGMFGEKGQIIAEAVVGEPWSPTCYYDPQVHDRDKPLSKGHMLQMLGKTMYTLMGIPKGRYDYSQYLFRQVSWFIEHIDRIRDKEEPAYGIQSKLRLFSYIYYFDEHPNTAKDDPYARACADRLMAEYESGQWYGVFNEWMDTVKQTGLEPYLTKPRR